MDGSMFSGLDNVFRALIVAFFVLLFAAPFAIWKLVEIAVYIIHHIQ